MAKVKITQTKSLIDRTKRQRSILQALGLRKINQSVEKELNPAIEGMINKINHLVSVETID